MSTQVTITLPDDVYQRAQHLARLISCDVAEILTNTITISLPPFDASSGESRSVADLSDDDVLALTQLQLPPSQDRRLSLLLEKQQAGQLSQTEHSDLFALMQHYQAGLLRKAQALREAVQRGLREPLDP
jgi:hypothetical protein